MLVESVIDALVGGMIFAAAVGALWWVARRYARFTRPSSNSPGGRRTDWPGFFGRRRR